MTDVEVVALDEGDDLEGRVEGEITDPANALRFTTLTHSKHGGARLPLLLPMLLDRVAQLSLSASQGIRLAASQFEIPRRPWRAGVMLLQSGEQRPVVEPRRVVVEGCFTLRPDWIDGKGGEPGVGGVPRAGRGERQRLPERDAGALTPVEPRVTGGGDRGDVGEYSGAP